ncbi:uncharacterized protein FIBRA_01559 [Fibroporia radiculosa]|uniref:Uncharacterized protein n=1 Tax=Fibroporia radiculosa TaxID=599839 RepID=J4I8J9_9APHY|nr:uncharacterized protein FIBRA_01559 [Fibroporia radiculosa]CCL99541.1 predicted protein [Fibroporia radiculosa]
MDVTPSLAALDKPLHLSNTSDVLPVHQVDAAGTISTADENDDVQDGIANNISPVSSPRTGVTGRFYDDHDDRDSSSSGDEFSDDDDDDDDDLRSRGRPTKTIGAVPRNSATAPSRNSSSNARPPNATTQTSQAPSQPHASPTSAQTTPSNTQPSNSARQPSRGLLKRPHSIQPTGAVKHQESS